MEIVAARGLLGVDLPDPVGRGRPGDHAARRRSGSARTWSSAACSAFALVTALPMALGLRRSSRSAGDSVRRAGLPFGDWNPGALTAAGVVLLVLLGYAVAGLGALAAQLAPTLLGPSPASGSPRWRPATGRLVERNRLARELHDSVGHALTVTTLQAAAARRALDTTRSSSGGRWPRSRRPAGPRWTTSTTCSACSATAERDRPPAPQRTLADLDRLVADVTGAGLRVTATRDGPIATVPAVVSREGYRIVQEA